LRPPEHRNRPQCRPTAGILTPDSCLLSPVFASSSLLALFGEKRKGSKISHLHPPNGATLARNADQAYRPPRIPQDRRAGRRRARTARRRGPRPTTAQVRAAPEAPRVSGYVLSTDADFDLDEIWKCSSD
jgi:hypothetical protein